MKGFKKGKLMRRQNSALCMIAIFISIQSVKFTHIHPLYSSPDHSRVKKAALKHAQSICKICDYHFSKNTTLTDDIAVIPPRRSTHNLLDFHHLLFSNSVIGLCRGRAPPYSFSV